MARMADMADRYVTRREAAALLRVTTRTLVRWERDGKLQPHGGGRTVLYDRKDVEALADNGQAEAAARKAYHLRDVDGRMAGVDPEALARMPWGQACELAEERGVSLAEMAAWQDRQ